MAEFDFKKIVEPLQQFPDAERAQLKLDLLIAIMEGETANFSAGVYVPLLAGFAIAVGNTGINPFKVLAQVARHARDETQKLLKDQGISTAN